MADHKSWTLQNNGTTYLCSTDPSYLDLKALNAALGSDMLWWASELPEDRLRTMIDNCIILALYQVESESNDGSAQSKDLVLPTIRARRAVLKVDMDKTTSKTPRSGP